MANPNISGMPGMGAMNDTLDFVKNMWGAGMNMPGMAMPAMSVEEINKQIQDLKTVESWLQLNMNMLRGTIQALEVQSATFSVLQSMSESMASMVSPAAGASAEQTQEAPGSQPESAPEQQGATGTMDPAPDQDAIPGAAAFANPTAWWGLLQDQFRQALDTTLAPPAKAPDSAAARKRPARPAAKTAARTPKPPSKAAAKTTKKRRPKQDSKD